MDARWSRPLRSAALGVGAANSAYAAATGNEGGVGGWVILFLAFGALVILFQALPAAVLFGSMLKGLLAPMGGRAREKSKESSSG